MAQVDTIILVYSRDNDRRAVSIVAAAAMSTPLPVSSRAQIDLTLSSRAQIDLTGEFSMTNVELSKSWAAFSPSNSACPSRFLKVGRGEKEICGNEVEIPAKKRPKVFNNSV